MRERIGLGLCLLIVSIFVVIIGAVAIAALWLFVQIIMAS